jgi:D-arginine dehydrogenase
VYVRDQSIFCKACSNHMSIYDVAIIGAGIAGASLAAEIGNDQSVLLLEGENAPGYHSTGRSAAFWTETYGGPAVQPLTTASGPLLAQPPTDFADRPLMQRRGALHIGQASDKAAGDAMLADFANSAVTLHQIHESETSSHIKGLRPGWTEAVWEPDCCDIDVAALHAAFLKKARKAGVELHCNAPLKKAIYQNGRWHVDTGEKHFSARILVNAAGAWADDVAGKSGLAAIGITPYRRTIMQLAIEPSAPANLPLVIGLDGSFYFKPDAGGRLWLSPHDEIRCSPYDAQPEEIDVARAIDRLQQVVDWKVMKLERKWAGLRSFAPDRLPVIGPDPNMPQFFWLAGQGGFGIQTAPAVAQMAAALLAGQDNPVPNTEYANYAPDRLR